MIERILLFATEEMFAASKLWPYPDFEDLIEMHALGNWPVLT